MVVSAILDRRPSLGNRLCCCPRLVLQAADRGSPRLTGTTTVQIQVVDVNDNTPVITPIEPITIAESEFLRCTFKASHIHRKKIEILYFHYILMLYHSVIKS